MNHLPLIPSDPEASVEAQAIADLDALDRKLQRKKSQGRAAVPEKAGRKQTGRPVAFVGIDPGATGCAALVFDGGHDLFDWPGDPALVVPRLADWLARFDVRLAALEKVHAMPGQGVVSMFSFGQNVGTWHGILAALAIPYVSPRPQDWQRGLVDKKAGKDSKAASLATARRLFPDAALSRKKDHGRADALLLAWWARRQGIGGG
jgi:crossover junction endodeoxyribonuclease RuvC